MRIADCGLRIVVVAACFLSVVLAERNCALSAPETQSALGKEVSKVASRGPVRLAVKVDHDEVQIPESVTLTVSVESEKGDEITWPPIGDTLGDFGVRSVTEQPPTEDLTTQTHAK